MEAVHTLANVPAPLRDRLRLSGRVLEIGLSSWAVLFRPARGRKPGWLTLARSAGGKAPFTAAEIAALGRLAADQDRIGGAILDAVAAAVPRIGDVLGLVDGDESVALPARASMGPALAPERAILHDLGGAALVGIAFACGLGPGARDRRADPRGRGARRRHGGDRRGSGRRRGGGAGAIRLLLLEPPHRRARLAGGRG
ncbi:hypothetical protein [Methylobacterium nigriterrae]|uniref:hypothetical protein n=1 Tax=Methylobacterium nigriterrae TaxID=3127512 RepID=UPI0030133F04